MQDLIKRQRFDPWVRKIPWRRKWQSTPMFLPRRSHGQRSMAGYSPWGSKELDMGWDKYKSSKMSKLMKHHTPQPQLLKNALSCSFQKKKRKNCCLVTKSCPTLLQPMDCGPAGSSVYGISQTSILEWVAISFFRGSS